jgi:hypothetical protein
VSYLHGSHILKDSGFAQELTMEKICVTMTPNFNSNNIKLDDFRILSAFMTSAGPRVLLCRVYGRKYRRHFKDVTRCAEGARWVELPYFLLASRESGGTNRFPPGELANARRKEIFHIFKHCIGVVFHLFGDVRRRVLDLLGNNGGPLGFFPTERNAVHSLLCCIRNVKV